MLDVIASVEADASFTGAVKDASGSAEDSREAEAGDAANGGNSASGEGAPPLIDEPATVIVMHRYAEILEELAPAASPVAAARARAEVARVGSLYDQLDDIARRAAQWDESEDGVEEEAPDDRTVRPRRSRRERLNADRPGARGPAAPNLSDQFRQMRETHDAVEDVQAQALVRELQLIKAMVADGSIDAAHAKDLRNDVYIQQLVLD